jgi:hypothetical protein
MTQGRANRWLWRYAAPLAAGLAVLALLVIALPSVSEVRSSVPSTASAASRGPCLLPAAEMRRIHMDLLRHERSVAVREGLRTPGASIQQCVSCHVVSDVSGAPVAADDTRHFCRSCHEQVAIRTDCFSCHRSTPAATLVAGGQP